MGILDWIRSGGGEVPKDNPWRKLYDPGTSPNPGPAQGASYYDKVNSPNAPSVWESVLQSESFRRKSFDEIDADRDGFITPEELGAAVGPGHDAKALVRAADTGGRGRVSRHDFDAVMSRHAGTS